MNKRLVIIDGNSLLFRAYYAMQRPMITKNGQYTQGIYGFLNMLSKIRKEHEPAYLAVTFDLKAPTFRHIEYPEYKAGRKKTPPELLMQFEPLKEVLRAMNIAILELEGFEGDDLIGTVARRGEEAGLEPLIITGDRDALQLASDITQVMITKKGISEFALYDTRAMLEEYHMTPAQFIDYKGLRGDTSDNIPGIPGVGEKTAMQLIETYGSLENILEHVSEISAPKLRQKIEENANLAIMSKRLATINVNSPIEFKFEDLQVKEPDLDKLIDIYVKLEFNSFLKKLDRGGAATAAHETPAFATAKVYEFGCEVCEHGQVAGLVKAQADSGKPLAFTSFSDGNHKDVPIIMGLGFLSGDKVYFIRESDTEGIKEFAYAIANTQVPLLGHNMQADYYAFMANYHFDTKDHVFNTCFDTAVAEYVLNPTASDYLLKGMSLEYLHKDIRSMEQIDDEAGQVSLFSDSAASYSAFAAEYISAMVSVYEIQQAKLKAEGLTHVAEDIEFPLIEVMASMEAEGFKLETGVLREIGSKLTAGISALTKEIYELAGEEFNINSPQQLGNILFEKLGLPAGKKTKKGYSTSAEILEKLAGEYPIVAKVLEYRQLSKLNSTYVEGLTPLKATDGRIHAHFQQTVTATGRISCTEPNLQNIPVRQPLGREIRRAFIPRDEEHILVGADYSQIELRILAHLSGEQHLIDAFNSGADIHRMTASKVFGIPFDEVTKEQRSNAKAVNFGVIYGMSGFGLASELNISRKAAESYIKDYFAKYTAVKAYMDKQVANAKATGYSETMTGRKRAIHEISASNFMVRQLGERLAMNTPIQGSAADIIKMAMTATYRELNKRGFKSRLILQVHDELIIDALRSEAEAVTAMLLESMQGVCQLSVELTAEPGMGENWYELK